MLKTPVSVLFTLALLLLTAGCWDRVEIDERGFVIGVAIDVPKSSQKPEQGKAGAEKNPRGKARYAVTYQFVVTGKLQNAGGSNNPGSGQAYLNLTSEGDALFDIDKQLAGRTSRFPYYEHLKVIAISEEIARKEHEFARVLDFFLREPEMRRSAKVFVTEGEARNLLNVEPSNEKLPVMYINSVSENSGKNARILPETKLGDIHEYLLGQRSFVVQRMMSAEDRHEVKLEGAAVIRGENSQMAGALGPEETEGLNLLTGKFRTGIVKAEVKDELVVCDLFLKKRTINADVSNPQRIRFRIRIEAEGAVGESYQQSLEVLKRKSVDMIEQAAEREIVRITKAVVRKLQHDFQADAMGLGANLQQNHYKVWKRIGDNWEKGKRYFTQCEIQVEPRVIIRRTGTVNRSNR
ncbi:Ger(x)C family spore germination protein [Paenibacillus ehimensis]|uniref:Ger(x)C family spore germination protein n=1 Tax=Paenibacillus ehimensis TaxID=79264 RepID=UPI002DBA49C4|nr:Ger(x)C family spore germination protein [Paenibacillus ehimensis]MEC0209335.1 Ger(x)C family spore germination protein [Paenibacillus ehimensis]